MRPAILRGVALALVAAPTLAQELEPRYELGVRLRRFERAYGPADEEARARTLPALERSVAAFFRDDAPEAAAALDEARRALAAPDAGREAEWLDGLALLPETRVVDPGDGPLLVRVEHFCGVTPPPEARFRLWLGAPEDSQHALGEPFGLSGGAAELEVALPVPASPLDTTLVLEALGSGDVVLASVSVGLSLVPDLETRLDALGEALPLLSALVDSRVDVRGDSATGNLALIEELLAGTVVEADVPAAALLCELESVARLETPPGLARAGTEAVERWLHLRPPVGEPVPCRFLDAAREGAPPPPLVVALHGAGGSEHMVFDGFGAGAFVEEAARRGWSVLAPRLEPGRSMDVVSLLYVLEDTFVFDRDRVALVGHSMGAALALATVEADARVATPHGGWRALVSLGGGRAPASPGAFDALDVLAAGGIRDFALPGVRSLHAALEARTAARTGRRTELYVVPASEHLTVVQAALPRVFAFLDASLRASVGQER